MPRVKKREIARPSRLKLLLRRQRRLFRPLALSVISFAIVMAGLFVVHSAQTGGWAARVQKAFARNVDLRVQQIVINGRANTPEPLLRAALGVSTGDPILGFSVSAARDRIESLSWVAHVAVERRPFAIWQSQGKFLLIDRNGEIVANEDVVAFGNLPLVVGAAAPAHAASLLDLLETVPDIRDRVAAAVRVGERRWNLQLKNGITVMLPEGHEEAALKRLHDLQTTQTLLDRPLVFIDLRLPDRLAVRIKPSAQIVPDPNPADAHPPDVVNRRAT